ATTAGHMVDLLASQQDPAPPDEATSSLIDMIRTRCEADRWTAEARACLAKIATPQDADACGALLTEEQQANLVRDQQARSDVPGGAPEPGAGAGQGSMGTRDTRDSAGPRPPPPGPPPAGSSTRSRPPAPPLTAD